MNYEMKRKNITYEYIRGLIDGEGSFTFSTRKQKMADGTIKNNKIPTFCISMHERDRDLLVKVRDKLGLKNNIYDISPYTKDGFNRERRAFLTVREFASLKNIIIPCFYNKLIGYKNDQFFSWLERIGTDPDVPKSYKLFYRLHKSGFYEKNVSKFDKVE